jgi:signal transduction histidine kinase
MRIRRMLHVSTVVGLAFVLMVAATILTLLVLDAQHSVETQRLDNAVRKMSVMRSLQPDFSHSQNPRAIQQWQAVHAELTPILNLMPALDERSQTLKAHVNQEQAALATLFEHLSAANQDSVGTDIRELIGGQLSVRSASMVSDILTIRDLTDQQIVREKRWVTAGAAGSVAVLTGVILVLLRIMYRRIAGPIAKLEVATANLSAGHLDQPVFMSGSDEISGLAESFDRMRVALRDRLLDLSDTKARLEDANVHLEHRVLERTQQLEIALTQIRELDQAKSRFFANVSHELRTPLALILGPVDELLADGSLPPEGRYDLEVVRRNARTLHTYVNDLLDLSRLDAGGMRLDYSETDLARAVRSVADHFVSASAHRGIDLRLTMPDAVAAQVDQAKVCRVLFNLMSNAFKHVPDGTGRVEVALMVGDMHATIEVIDNGPGIPAEMRERIFERFVQGDDPQRSAGTGLGLAIAEEFVALHGGGITVDDADGPGALFRIVLPLTAPEGTHVAGDGEILGNVYLVPVEEPQAGRTEVEPVDIASTMLFRLFSSSRTILTCGRSSPGL